MKDPKRYSHSRIATFKTCPRKHHYIYIEGIETPDTPETIPGRYFHECLERINAERDISDLLDGFRNLCTSGKLDMEPDLLEYIVAQYFSYYKNETAKENVLMCEKEFKDDLYDGDYFVGKADKVFESDGYITIRDTKTTRNALKYTHDDVQFNAQLLIYVPMVEAILGSKVNAIQIDEVRMAKLQPVPITSKGKPTTDKKQLGLVTAEDYENKLNEMGLAGNAEFQTTLDYLRQRGHPLFNRVTAQIVSENMVSNNASDFVSAYKAAKLDPDYRVKGPLCRYCQYSELCMLDYESPDQTSREMIIKKISE